MSEEEREIHLRVNADLAGQLVLAKKEAVAVQGELDALREEYEQLLALRQKILYVSNPVRISESAMPSFRDELAKLAHMYNLSKFSKAKNTPLTVCLWLDEEVPG